MSDDLKPWGESYHPGIPHAQNYGCQNPQCGWDMILKGEDHSIYAVGFSLDNPWQSSLPDKIVGVLIFECPECLEKFWVHANENWYQMITEGKERTAKS